MTVPFVDPMFSQVYARELELSGSELWEDHSGVPAIDRSAPDTSPPRAGRSIGRTTADVETVPTLSTECFSAAPLGSPVVPSLSHEQVRESLRIQLMIASHRFKVAERERLDDEAHAREWLS